MKIKKYTVSEMQQAIQLIKQDLGPEAVIVSSHKVRGKGWQGWLKKSLEVTAVLDDVPVVPAVQTLPPLTPTEPPEAVVAIDTELVQSKAKKAPAAQEILYMNYQLIRSQDPTSNSFNGQIERLKLQETSFQPLLDEALLKMAEIDLKGEVEKMELLGKTNHVYQQWLEKLIDMDIQEGVAKALLEDALKDMRDTVSGDLVELALINKAAQILKSANRRESDARFMTFVGQPGVGKTTTLTKLATRFQLLQKKKVVLITIYTYRYGSIDQMKVYGDTIDVPVEVVMTPAELRQAIEKHADKDHILIDTVGRSSKNTGQVLELKAFLEVIPGEQDVFLVLNASTKNRDIFRIIENFRIAHFNKYIFTKTDETETLGSILNVVSRTGIPVAYYTDGQSIPDDLEKAQPKKLANLLFRSADHYEESQP